MSAYLIANVDIKDTEKFKDYMKATPPVIKQFGGKFLVRCKNSSAVKPLLCNKLI